MAAARSAPGDRPAPQAGLRVALGRWRPVATAAMALYALATLVLPLAALLATALVPTYGVRLTLDSLTVANFAEGLLRQGATLRAFLNSTLAAGTAVLVLAGAACLLAVFLGARHRAPRLVISVAFILAFLKPLPVLGLSLYNTRAIIVLAYLAAVFSVALKPVAAARGQLDPSLDDAARVSGAGFGRRMRRVFGPLLAPAAASGAILVFLAAYNEVTVSALLWSTGHETIGTTIFNYEDGGYTVLAAAMASVTVGATVLLMPCLDLLGRRLPPGVVPWRL